MGRRTSLASLASAKVDDVPGKSDPLLLSLPLDKLVPTRFNPRRRFGTDEELREFGQKLAREQLQPAVVVSKAAYLKLWPEEADHVGDASYVIANGERRYRASKLVGRPTLEVVHKEDIASSRAAFLDAVQSENNDREDLDPIERALGVDIMVTQLGGADPVAVYYGKTKGWVSQQRKLLKLTPALQDLVSTGEMPVRVARDIAGLPADVQGTAWEEEVERRRLEKQAAAQLRAQAAERSEPSVPAPAVSVSRFTAVNQPPSAEPEATGFTAVKQPAPAVADPAAVPGEDRTRFTAVNQLPTPGPEPVTPDSPAAQPLVPVQQGGIHQGAEQPTPETAQPAADTVHEGKRFPYDDPTSAGMHLSVKMGDAVFLETMAVMYRQALARGLTPPCQHNDQG